MKRFISCGYYKSELDVENSNISSNSSNNEEIGMEVSNFYKNNINNNITKLPERLSKRLKPSTSTTTASTSPLNTLEGTQNTEETIPITSATTLENKKNNYCDYCETEYTDKIQHETSTTHILCVKTKENFKAVRYSSSKLKDNVGYRLLLDKGWSDGQGLGLENQGTINPLENEQKSNKYGIGKEKEIKTQIQEKENNNILETINDPTTILPKINSKKKNNKFKNNLKKERESRIRELL